MSAFKIILLFFRLLVIALTLLLLGMPYLSPESAGALYFLSFIALPLLVLNLLMAFLSRNQSATLWQIHPLVAEEGRGQ